MSKPPSDLIATAEQSVSIVFDDPTMTVLLVENSFKMVDAYKFPLNDADKSSNATEKWCIAYTWVVKFSDGSNELYGETDLVRKIDAGWEILDTTEFSAFEDYPADKTSCRMMQDKYLP